MSIESWMEEFYPVNANDIEAELFTTDKDLVLHSIKKWEGGLKKNCRKHQVAYEEHAITEEGLRFLFDAKTCALCHRHLLQMDSCGSCPIYRANKDTACDDSRDQPRVSNTFYASVDSVMPMLRLLKKTLKMLEKEQLAKSADMC